MATSWLRLRIRARAFPMKYPRASSSHSSAARRAAWGSGFRYPNALSKRMEVRFRRVEMTEAGRHSGSRSHSQEGRSRVQTDSYVVHIVDDEEPVRKPLALLLTMSGFTVRVHESATSFLAAA